MSSSSLSLSYSTLIFFSLSAYSALIFSSIASSTARNYLNFDSASLCFFDWRCYSRTFSFLNVFLQISHLNSSTNTSSTSPLAIAFSSSSAYYLAISSLAAFLASSFAFFYASSSSSYLRFLSSFSF